MVEPVFCQGQLTWPLSDYACVGTPDSANVAVTLSKWDSHGGIETTDDY